MFLPPVRSLLLPRCPSTVARFVVSVYINAIKSVSSGGPRPHVSSKRQVVVDPSVANCYPSSAIVLECYMTTAATSVPHGCPAVVLGRFGSSPRMPVLCKPLGGFLLSETSAASGHSALQFSSLGDYRAPALAPASPHGMSFVYPTELNNGKPTEDLTFELRPGGFLAFYCASISHRASSLCKWIGNRIAVLPRKGVYRFA